jgi:hypothetical protein
MTEVTEIVTVYGETEDDDADTICEFPEYIDKEIRAANARRIVACVNALEGIPTDELEKAGTGLMSDAAVCVGEITKECYRLKEELKSIANQLEEWANVSNTGGWSTHQVTPMRKKADEIRLVISGVKRI